MKDVRKTFFIDVDSFTESGCSSEQSGSVFLSRVPEDKKRVIGVIAEGKGARVKAEITAAFTASMVLRLSEQGMSIQEIGERITQTGEGERTGVLDFPSFSVVIVHSSGYAELLERGIPAVRLYRECEYVGFDRENVTKEKKRSRGITFSSFSCESGDRIILFTPSFTSLFTGSETVENRLKSLMCSRPDISSRELIRNLYSEGSSTGYFSGEEPSGRRSDETQGFDGCCFTMASVHLRKARKLLVVTGAPYSKEKDTWLAGVFNSFTGRRAVCGGTTAAIIGRELARKIVTDASSFQNGVPPEMMMDGADLMTEGTVTLGQVQRILEYGIPADFHPANAPEKLVSLCLDSDLIRFIVGTRVNETHQDPTLPVELDIRRNVVRRISAILEEKYLKECSLELV